MKIFLLKNDDASMLDWIKQTKPDPYSFSILERKTVLPVFYIKDVKVETANILKQTSLSVGCDCSISRDVISGSRELSDVIVMCTFSQLIKMKEKLKGQPFSLEKITDAMIKKTEYKEKFKVGGKDLLADKKYLIMGILNLTDNSFYDGGRYNTLNSAMKRIEQMLEEGADIIDIGGESTKPSSDPVSEEDETARVMPVLKEAKKQFKDAVFSVDTYKSNTAEKTLSEGAQIINDISGLSFDCNMAAVISKHNASCILMHIKGTPKNMQENPSYENVVLEVAESLSESVRKAEENNISLENISIDPGIGFGKSKEHNLKLLANIEVLRSLEKPVCIGVSNKRFIGSILDKKEDERTNGTVGANVAALKNKAKIFRVHNVKENSEALRIAQEITDAGH